MNLLIFSMSKSYERILRTGLEDKGHTVNHFECPHGPNREIIATTATKKFFPLFLIWLLGRYILVSGIIFFKAVKNLNKVLEADAILVGHQAESGFPAAFIISKILNTPLMFFTHMSSSTVLFEKFDGFEKSTYGYKLLYWSDKLMHRCSDKIFTFSSSLADVFSKHFKVDREKYCSLYYYDGFLLPSKGEEDEFKLSEESEKQKEVDVIYWGNFLPYHGTDTMVKAAEKLKDRQFVLAGNTERITTEREKIKDMAEEKDLENVEFPGFLPLEELLQYIKEADVVLGVMGDTIYTQNLIPTKVAEACFHGKLVVTADSPGVRELFKDGKNIVMSPSNDPEKLANNIRKALEMEDKERKKIGRNARKIYERYFSPDARANRFLEVYRPLKEQYS